MSQGARCGRGLSVSEVAEETRTNGMGTKADRGDAADNAARYEDRMWARAHSRPLIEFATQSRITPTRNVY